MADGLTRSSPDDPLLSLVNHEALHPAPKRSTPASAAMTKNRAAPRWEVGVVPPLAVLKDHPPDNALRPVPSLTAYTILTGFAGSWRKYDCLRESNYSSRFSKENE